LRVGVGEGVGVKVGVGVGGEDIIIEAGVLCWVSLFILLFET
jgi:hypothetical protein